MQQHFENLCLDSPRRPEIRDAFSPGTALGCVAQVLARPGPVPYLANRAQNPYHLKHAPPMPLPDFTERLEKYFACSAPTYPVAAALLRRLHVAAPELFSIQSAHKLILAGLTIAAKFTDDAACKQTHYARCGGVDVAELNLLEATFLARLQFSTFVTEAEYDECCELLLHLDSNPLGDPAMARSALASADVHAYKRDRAMAVSHVHPNRGSV